MASKNTKKRENTTKQRKEQENKREEKNNFLKIRMNKNYHNKK